MITPNRISNISIHSFVLHSFSRIADERRKETDRNKAATSSTEAPKKSA